MQRQSTLLLHFLTLRIFLESISGVFGVFGMFALICACSLYLALENTNLSFGNKATSLNQPAFSGSSSSSDTFTHPPSERSISAIWLIYFLFCISMYGCFLFILPFERQTPCIYAHLASTEAVIYLSGIKESISVLRVVISLLFSFVTPRK